MLKRRDEIENLLNCQGCIYRHSTIHFWPKYHTRVYYDLQMKHIDCLARVPTGESWKVFLLIPLSGLSIAMNRDESFARKSRNWRFKYSTCTGRSSFSFFFFIEGSCGTFPGALLRSATCRSMELTSGMNTITPLPYLYIRKNFRGATGFGPTEQRK